MSGPIIEAPVSDAVRAAVAKGWELYEASTREHGKADEWDRRVIDQVIHAFVRQGRPFSANDLRPLLPEVRKCLISRRLIQAQLDGLIRYVGVTPSTLRSTKAARVNVYAPVRGALTDRESA
ncbi:hypothetical protein [Nocardioides lianchengensis]|uniref:Uncharacterized protein n=1 Tax=Nocardioides lianchengensis TaxID=1045774 RepID=A0A1G6LPM3_9ACTN|nr:hypothetical protein [Nocardioides lianchengensis]NYG12485.1 hypothetical protein [Nocardioides lianchengensis]SDC45151.1 hypothetical protein SAMN05421872_102320 [Nocardioides lianchengensis]